jgi:hypothetical protein
MMIYYLYIYSDMLSYDITRATGCKHPRLSHPSVTLVNEKIDASQILNIFDISKENCTLASNGAHRSTLVAGIGQLVVHSGNSDSQHFDVLR